MANVGASSGTPTDDDYYYGSTGAVCWKKSGDIPDGWIMMAIDDVKKNQVNCRAALGDWDIVALQDGTVDGRGYGF